MAEINVSSSSSGPSRGGKGGDDWGRGGSNGKSHMSGDTTAQRNKSYKYGRGRGAGRGSGAGRARGGPSRGGTRLPWGGQGEEAPKMHLGSYRDDPLVSEDHPRKGDSDLFTESARYHDGSGDMRYNHSKQGKEC